MKLPNAFNQWLMDRKLFPIIWLTYKRRIARDIESVFKLEGVEDKLGQEYIDKLATAIQQTEGWVIKLISIQVSITAFFVFSFISNVPSVSLFGIALSNIAGLKEIFLAVWFTLGMLIAALSTSKDTMLFIVKTIFERSEDKKLLPLTSLALPAPFNMRVYVTRNFDNWIFSAAPTKIFFGLMTILLTVAVLGLWVFSTALSVVILHEVYKNPTLGGWSTALLTYSGIMFAASLLWFIRFNFPFPYRDKSELKHLEELKTKDVAAYLALRTKIFGSKR
jgi:hypothetical protein